MMKGKLLFLAIAVLLVAGLVGGATMALFTDTAANAGNTFTAGTVDIEVGEQPTVPVHVYNMAPGDTYDGEFTVVNEGSLELRFSVDYDADGDLFSDLGDDGNTPAVVLGLDDDQNVVLGPGASAAVAFSVYLPFTAGNEYQGVSGTVDFTINAVQTANNPLGLLANGGFETGDFTGWDVNFPELATVVNSYVSVTGLYDAYGNPIGGPIYIPYAGGYFAVLQADAEDVYTTVSQTVTLSAGQKLAGWAAFDAGDYLPYNDDAAVVIVSGGPLAAPWQKSVVDVGDHGQSAWEFWSWTAPADGVYTLELRVRNVGDAGLPSFALFDANVIQ